MVRRVRASTFPRRGLVEVYDATRTYLHRRSKALFQALFGTEKGRKGWLSLPPRLGGANEGGTDRPVCTLPLSGSILSCLDPEVHVASVLVSATCVSLSPLFPHFSFAPAITKFYRPRSRRLLFRITKKRKKKRADVQVHH